MKSPTTRRFTGLGLSDPCHAVYDLALARVLDFAASLALPLTLFVIARNLEREQNVAGLKRGRLRRTRNRQSLARSLVRLDEA